MKHVSVTFKYHINVQECWRFSYQYASHFFTNMPPSIPTKVTRIACKQFSSLQSTLTAFKYLLS